MMMMMMIVVWGWDAL